MCAKWMRNIQGDINKTIKNGKTQACSSTISFWFDHNGIRTKNVFFDAFVSAASSKLSCNFSNGFGLRSSHVLVLVLPTGEYREEV